MNTTTAPQLYADEEVSSSYTYPEGHRPRSIAEQVASLRELFPALKDATFDESIATRPLPEGAEGWFAIPRPEKLAPTNNAAVEAVLNRLAETRSFHNYRLGQLGPERLRQSDRTVHALDLIGQAQKGHDILIVPAQFGKRHRGRSVRRAREVFTPNEFGLGAYEVGIMLLTHPERLTSSEDLWIDCAGDEYSGGGQFDGAPYFGFDVGQLSFDTYWSDGARARYGSSSGFLPPALPQLQRGGQ